jgi:L-amino acid N-acyltransferase YncA
MEHGWPAPPGNSGGPSETDNWNEVLKMSIPSQPAKPGAGLQEDINNALADAAEAVRTARTLAAVFQDAEHNKALADALAQFNALREVRRAR